MSPGIPTYTSVYLIYCAINVHILAEIIVLYVFAACVKTGKKTAPVAREMKGFDNKLEYQTKSKRTQTFPCCGMAYQVQ